MGRREPNSDAADDEPEFLRPVTNRRTFEEVVSRLQGAIASGDLGPGDRLPSERELAERLAVSRTSVREALRVLEALGIVRIRRGAEHGATVVEKPGTALDDVLRTHLELRHINVADVVEFRMVIGSWAAARCAGDHRPEVAEDLRRLVDRMGDDAQTPAGFQELESAFHLALIRGARNELGTLVTQALGTTMRKTMMDAIRDSDDWPSQRERLVDGLREIADAIADGDRDRAAELTTRHIATFWEDQLPRPRGGAR